MLLILEVVLTVVAWRKGWRALALLPLAVGVPVGVLMTVSANSMVPAFVTDVLITIALIAMSAKGRTQQTAAQPARESAEEVTRQHAA